MNNELMKLNDDNVLTALLQKSDEDNFKFKSVISNLIELKKNVSKYSQKVEELEKKVDYLKHENFETRKRRRNIKLVKKN